MITVALDAPWLEARLPRAMRCLGWAPVNPGFHHADRVLWRQVRNADLHEGFDAETWFADQVAARAPGAVGMLTSRDVARWHMTEVEVEGIRAAALTTVGLSNAEAVGQRQPWHPADYGTINILVAVDAGLTKVAQMEALSITVEARTAAVMEAALHLPTGIATGTGTDCITLACDAGDIRYAGLHTAVGEAIGAATRKAVFDGVGLWLDGLAREKAARGLA